MEAKDYRIIEKNGSFRIEVFVPKIIEIRRRWYGEFYVKVVQEEGWKNCGRDGNPVFVKFSPGIIFENFMLEFTTLEQAKEKIKQFIKGEVIHTL